MDLNVECWMIETFFRMDQNDKLVQHLGHWWEGWRKTGIWFWRTHNNNFFLCQSKYLFISPRTALIWQCWSIKVTGEYLSQMFHAHVWPWKLLRFSVGSMSILNSATTQNCFQCWISEYFGGSSLNRGPLDIACKQE